MKKIKSFLLKGHIWLIHLSLLTGIGCSITTNHYYCSEHKSNTKNQDLNKPEESKKNTDE